MQTKGTATKPTRPSELAGLGRLTVDAVHGITDMVEALHHTIARLTAVRGAPAQDRTHGVTRLVYQSIHTITGLIGQGLDPLLNQLGAAIEQQSSSSARDAMRAVVNGVLGDHLATKGNPLAISMQLRHDGRPVNPADLAARLRRANGRLVVLVHGLCMHDGQWLRHGHDHGAALACDLGVAPLYLYYNTGRHISENGRAFANLLEATLNGITTLDSRPIDLVLIGHSMGGLVIRSACHYGARDGLAWPRRLRMLACLGSPHHGSYWEQGGNVVDHLLGISAYSAPFARLGKVRSSGITDLRHGFLVDDDWQDRGRFDAAHDHRTPVPIPLGVACYTMAGLQAAEAGGAGRRQIGDGLVSLDSALGRHPDPRRCLKVPDQHQWMGRGVNHFDLLDHPEVYATLKQWVATRVGS